MDFSHNLNYPPRLALAQLPTPLHPLDRFRDAIGCKPRLWVKRDDMTGCTISGNKVRKLEFTLAKAQQAGADVIITCGGVQSNHCRATVMLATQLGMKSHLLLRGEPEELTYRGNHFLDAVVGAQMDCYPSREFISRFDEILAQTQRHYEQQGLKTFFIPIGASDGTGVWGYIHACEEIQQQLATLDELKGIQFDDIVCAAGSGGTLAGLNAGVALYKLGARVWGINVCDDEAYFLRKTREDLDLWQQEYHTQLDLDSLQIRVIDGYVGPGYAKAEPPVYQTIKQLATSEGIVLDQIYTGKAFHGLVSEIQKGRFDDADHILFIHTGGLFGLMADDANKKLLC